MMAGIPIDIEGFQNSTMNIYGQDVWSDNAFISVSNFLEPSSIFHASDGADYKKIKSRKNSIDPEKYRVEQNFVSSKDGTSIPYFLISRKDMELDGDNPTILYGYGGFQISKPPAYLGDQLQNIGLMQAVFMSFRIFVEESSDQNGINLP